jgi:hypothetical protein
MTTNSLDKARAQLDAALREESQALANAQEAAQTSGPASAESVRTLGAAQAAHARSHAARDELRRVTADAERVEAAAQPLPVRP